VPSGEAINDLHYNGKTVHDRLAGDGLLDQFTAARQAGDGERMTDLLEQVAITKTWGKRLATMMLEESRRLPIRFNLEDCRNAGAIRHFEHRNELKFPPCMQITESPRDPYINLGTHPDIVEHLWSDLGSIVPEDCRCIVFGSPALIAPRSGILLAQAFGTRYVLRIPRESMHEAIECGAQTIVTWTGGQTTDLKQEYGNDWIFGCWLEREPTWLLANYNSAEGTN
jgi:hypothetical protein